MRALFIALLLAGCGTEITFSESLRAPYEQFSADAGTPGPEGRPSYVSWSATLAAVRVGPCLEPSAVFTAEGGPLVRRTMAMFGTFDPFELPTVEDGLAFWINAYNALVLRNLASLAAARPEASVADDDFAPLRTPSLVAKQPLAAEWIRHGVLRGAFDHESLREVAPDTLSWIRDAHRRLSGVGGATEPRVLFALACGARSCPDLPEAPLEGPTLDAALDTLTRAFLADEVKGAGPGGVSALLHWYAEDFRTVGGVPAFLARHGALRGTDPARVLPWDWRRPQPPDAALCADVPAVPPSADVDSGVGPEAECNGGNTRPCGPLATVGTCRPGEERCEGGIWEACTGAVEPTPESCDGQDEDCDGQTDEEAMAGPDDRPCPNSGVCEQAVVRCAAGAWTCDLPLAFEVEEASCDGLDNDCDGQTDEALAPPGDLVCAGVGLCADATAACVEGAWACVFPEGYAPDGESVCDGLDEDCDAVIDENIAGCTCAGGARRPCGRAVGACSEGEQVCDGGTWGSCSGVTPREEACDGVDNDCDGAVDDGVANACGGCGAAPLEVCDGADQDCDGRVDEGVVNACGQCGEAPVEVCNGADDDCDGRPDEGVANACGGCGEATPETCNGLDDDCDGQLDEGLNAPPGIDCPQAGVCDGVEPGCAGAEGFGCLFPATYEAIETSCDFRDNDCDGAIDEELLNRCDFCGPPPQEICNYHRDDDCDGIIDEGCPIDPNSQPMRE